MNQQDAQILTNNLYFTVFNCSTSFGRSIFPSSGALSSKLYHTVGTFVQAILAISSYNLNSLSKILVCGADDTIIILDLCLCQFLLDLFLFFWGGDIVFCGVYFIISDLVYFVDWNIVTLNGRSIVMMFLLEWMSLLFMGFFFNISSLIILYSDDNIFDDLNIFRFILLVLMFVVSIMFLIVSSNVISILLGWDGLGLVSFLLVIYIRAGESSC